MRLSVGFAGTVETPSHAAIAEELGYRHVWVFDSPALYADPWMTLAATARSTSVIGLGPGALVPSLRNVVASAAAALTLEGLAPGRVALAIGAGFTGAYALGRKPDRWDDVRTFVQQLSRLLEGHQISFGGSVAQLRQLEGVLPERPLGVPVLIAGNGPRAVALARDLDAGIFTSARPQDGFPRSAMLVQGTVLEPDEDVTSPRILETAGPAAAVKYHAMYERGDPRIRDLPNGERWLEAAEAIPAAERHLHVHEGHLTRLNDLDRRAVTSEFASSVTLTGHPEAVSEKLRELASLGVTELVYQPTGNDVPGELIKFAQVARSVDSIEWPNRR